MVSLNNGNFTSPRTQHLIQASGLNGFALSESGCRCREPRSSATNCETVLQPRHPWQLPRPTLRNRHSLPATMRPASQPHAGNTQSPPAVSDAILPESGSESVSQGRPGLPISPCSSERPGQAHACVQSHCVFIQVFKSGSHSFHNCLFFWSLMIHCNSLEFVTLLTSVKSGPHATVHEHTPN